MKKFKGFTLIELLVVIAIIALLLSILLPGLKSAKMQAQTIVCRSNLHQWGIAILMYTQQNDQRFWVENNVWLNGGTQGDWMKMLSSFYGDMDKFRLCPSAAKLNPPAGGIGTTFHQWGPGEIMELHLFGEDSDKNYGSYGTNLWINDVTPENPGWRGEPDKQWQTTVTRSSTGSIPLVADCVWFGTNPESFTGVRGGTPAPSSDFWESLDPVYPGNWDMDMARLTIDRHKKGINISFMDGSTDKVLLEKLWSLIWYRGYETTSYVDIEWLE
jgi:prepilin-type N-terminal cleavage/methylation domain-containing protein/prepilin-type processing-associated H-X9-DG protein